MPITFLRPMAPTVAFLLVAPAPISILGAQLGPPAVRWSNEFSRISGAAELPDGRVVIVDNRDGLLYLGAAGGGSAAQLGRQGEGPNEYQRPFSVIRGMGDTLLVYTTGGGRLMRISPAGAIAGSHQFSPSALGGSVAPPRGVDRLGRLYWDRPVIRTPGSNEIKRQQQYEVVRFSPGSEQVEVVAQPSDHAPELHQHRFHPFAQRDEWLIEADGTVLVIRARDYSLQWVRDGQSLRASTPIPFDPIRITGDDREAYRRERAANPSGAAQGRPPVLPDGSVTPEAMARMREVYPDPMFPAAKPPFVERGAFRSPGGAIWVVRAPTGPSLRGNRVDVLDASGRRLREVTLPDDRHLIALDRNGIYLVHEDEDGLQYLERYTWPQGLR